MFLVTTLIHSPKYDTKDYTDVPYIDYVAVLNKESEEITVFVVNRNLSEDILFDIDFRSFGENNLIEHIVLEHDELKAANTASEPDKVKPHSNGKSIIGDNGTLETKFAKASWNVIRLKLK